MSISSSLAFLHCVAEMLNKSVQKRVQDVPVPNILTNGHRHAAMTEGANASTHLVRHGRRQFEEEVREDSEEERLNSREGKKKVVASFLPPTKKGI
jgi:hypothetical protein